MIVATLDPHSSWLSQFCPAHSTLLSDQSDDEYEYEYNEYKYEYNEYKYEYDEYEYEYDDDEYAECYLGVDNTQRIRVRKLVRSSETTEIYHNTIINNFQYTDTSSEKKMKVENFL